MESEKELCGNALCFLVYFDNVDFFVANSELGVEFSVRFLVV
jgi:hypothetical protein